MNDIKNNGKIMNFRPILFSAFMFCAGIFSVYLYYLYSVIFYIFITSVCFIGIIFFSVLSKIRLSISAKRIYIVSSVLILFLLFGQFGAYHAVNSYVNANIDEKEYYVTCRIDDIKVYDDYNKLIVSNCNLSYYNVLLEPSYRMEVYMMDNCNYEIGDLIAFKSVVSNNSLKYDNRIQVDAITSKIKYSATGNGITVTGNDKNIFDRVKIFIKNTLKSGMSDQSFGIAYAMMVGDSSAVEEDTLNSFRNLGIAHLFAVSGSHIGFLSTIIFFALTRIPINKYIKYIIMLTVILFYSGVCGFSPSSLRAVIMCGVLYFSYLSGNKYDSLSSISFALLIVLFINPMELLSVGLMCSFACVYSIVLLAKVFIKRFYKLPDKLNSALAVSLSASIGILPVMLDVFGRISVVSVIVNILLIPIISVVFIAIFVIVFAFFYIPKISLFLPDKFLYVLSEVIRFFDYKFLIITGFTIGFFAITYYLIIILRSGIINVRIKINKIACISLAIITLLGVFTDNVICYNSTKVNVFGGLGACSLISCGDTDVLIVNDSPDYYAVTKLKATLINSIGNKIDYLVVTKNVTNVTVLVDKLSGDILIDNVIMFANDIPKISLKHTKTKYFAKNDYSATDVKCGNIEYCYGGSAVAFYIGSFKMLFSFELPTDFNYANYSNGYYDYIITGENPSDYSPYYSNNRLITYSSDSKNALNVQLNRRYIIINNKLFNYYK